MTARLTATARNRVLIGDALDHLRQLPGGSIDTVLTSPPYYRLRDYQIAGQYGLEDGVDAWVDHLAAVCAEIGRVLTPTGSLWLNLGDSYSTGTRDGAAQKSLLFGPERLALQLIAQGWRVRNKVVWAKPNAMPSSVRDRLACSYEVVYLLVRERRYFFDLDSVRAPHRSRAPKAARATSTKSVIPVAWQGRNSDGDSGLRALHAAGRIGHPLGKNPGDVWTLPTANYRGHHYAAMPLALAERAVRAGCPERRCAACHAPWQRRPLRAVGGTAMRGTLTPSCRCEAGSEPGLVLDPFLGTGTTALAATRHGRDWLGIELNPAFAAQALGRLRREAAA